MESALQKVFEYEGKDFRTAILNGELYFVAKDICEILAIKEAKDAVARLDSDERGLFKIDTLGGPQDMTVVTESGLYSLVLGSRKPEAKKFKKWVTSEVLPSIRKTGKYEVAPQHELPKTHAEALRMLADTVEQVEAQKKALAEAAPKVAFADAVNDSSNSMDLGVFAKILGTGRTRLFEWLREQGYFMVGSTKPYQTYIDNGYFVVIETTFTRGDTTQSYGKTQICGKGQLVIEKLWRDLHKEAA